MIKPLVFCIICNVILHIFNKKQITVQKKTKNLLTRQVVCDKIHPSNLNVGKKERRHEEARMRCNGYDDVDVHVLHVHALSR